MTTPKGGSGPASMRFALDEVLSGMLGCTDKDSFTGDAARLAAAFEELAGRFSLFAPLAAGVDPAAVSHALQILENKKVVQRDGGRYVLTPEGRQACVSSKRTLFNRGDTEELEQAARVFETL